MYVLGLPTKLNGALAANGNVISALITPDSTLVVFRADQTTDEVFEAINEELDGKGNEFVIVRCQNESAEHRKLFEERFEQDPDKRPSPDVPESGRRLRRQRRR